MVQIEATASRSQAIKAGIARAKEGRAQVDEANTLFKMFGLEGCGAYYENERRVEFRMFPFRVMGEAPYHHVEYFSRADHMRAYVNRMISKRMARGI